MMVFGMIIFGLLFQILVPAIGRTGLGIGLNGKLDEQLSLAQCLRFPGIVVTWPGCHSQGFSLSLDAIPSRQ